MLLVSTCPINSLRCLAYIISINLAMINGKSISEEEMKKRFGILRVMSTIFKIIGIAIAVLSIIGGLVSSAASFTNTDLFTGLGFDENTAALVGVFASLSALVLGLLGALLVYGLGELIMLLIAIEENTSKTANLLGDITEEDEEAEKE